MATVIKHTVLSSKLALTEMTDGFWLYDETRGMNLAMRAKTAEVAFVEALTYYQDRLTLVESEHKELKQKVDAFVSQFVDENDSQGY
jgi:hypothetical protein